MTLFTAEQYERALQAAGLIDVRWLAGWRAGATDATGSSPPNRLQSNKASTSPAGSGHRERMPVYRRWPVGGHLLTARSLTPRGSRGSQSNAEKDMASAVLVDPVERKLTSLPADTQVVRPSMQPRSFKLATVAVASDGHVRQEVGSRVCVAQRVIQIEMDLADLLSSLPGE
jgi:hypothetical protein